MYIIIAIIVFGVLIAIHEFGHFITAKATDVRVEEFSIGMGPALWKKQKGETLYAFRILPIGGYCAMAGEDEESDDPRAFTNKGFWPRLLILCAGSFMNFLLGVVLVFAMSFIIKVYTQPVIADFMEGCPYESKELFQEGDRICKINGQRVLTSSDLNMFLADGDGVYDFVVERDGEKLELNDVKLQMREYEGYEGLKFGFMFDVAEMNLANRLSYTWNQSLEFSRWVWMSLGDLIHGKVKLDDMSGPVGIVDMMNEVGSSSENGLQATYSLLYLAAFIAINLAIMNMLPIPALDGGRVFCMIVTVIIEAITKKKLDPKYEGYINAIGIILLLGLMFVIMYNDIMKIVIR